MGFLFAITVNFVVCAGAYQTCILEVLWFLQGWGEMWVSAVKREYSFLGYVPLLAIWLK